MKIFFAKVTTVSIGCSIIWFCFTSSKKPNLTFVQKKTQLSIAGLSLKNYEFIR
jgi:hypothetical protein